VADDVALLHLDDLASVEVKVGSADRGGGDADDRVVRLDEARVGDLVDADVLLAVSDDCSRARALPRSRPSAPQSRQLVAASKRGVSPVNRFG
jgi:hypothetical protein